jgi:hypothetical protein
MLKTIGYILLIISCISFLMILVVPFLGLSKMQLAGITTGLIIVGEVSFYSGLLIVGKSFWDKIKSKLTFWKTKPNEPDSENQNNLK